MIKNRSTLACLVLMAASAIPFSAIAKDAATEQYNVTAAAREVELAKSDYAAAREQVKLQTQRVSQEQARLKTEKQKLANAKARLAKAQANLDARKKVFDKTWNSK